MKEGAEVVSLLPEEAVLGIMHDLERPSSPVAQALRRSAAASSPPPHSAPAEAGAAEAIKELMREGAEVSCGIDLLRIININLFRIIFITHDARGPRCRHSCPARVCVHVAQLRCASIDLFLYCV